MYYGHPYGTGAAPQPVPAATSWPMPPPPGVPCSSADLSALIQLELLREIRKGRDDDGGSLIGARADGGTGIGKSLRNFEKLKKRVDLEPEKIIAEYVRRMKEQIGAEDGQPWSMMDVNRKLAWGKYRTLQRAHFMVANIFMRLDRGEYRPAQALCVQSMKCLHQAAIDGGGFDLAWPLTGLADPLRKERFGGEPEELEIIGQWAKSLDEVEKRARKGAGRGEDHETDEVRKPGKGGKKGKEE